MKFTAETLMVKPLNTKLLSDEIMACMCYDPDKISVHIYALALVNDSNIFSDNEAIYSYMAKAYNAATGKIDYMYSVDIYIAEKLEGGGIKRNMYPEFQYFIWQSDFEKYLLPEVSLKEHMVGRYNYNPRIIQNTNDLLKLINSVYDEQ